VFISDQYRLLFLEVPRTGSRSITQALTQLDPESPTVIVRRKCGILIDYHNCHIPQRVDETYIVVAAHRNPFERLWSHWKYRRQWGYPDVFKTISWPRYVTWACLPGAVPEIQNALPELPITEMLDTSRVTHWLDFRQLDRDWRQIEQETGIPLPPLDWINPSRQEYKIHQAYDAELSAMVVERFAKDFSHFDYDRNSWREI